MGIEPELLGVSTISWWNMVEQQFGTFENTKPFYTMFRNCLKSDLMLSDRLEATGLKTVLLDTLKYSFAGEPFKPPDNARALLEELVCPEHSLCILNIRGSKVLHLSNWPSWLNKGHKKNLAIFMELFYSKVGTQPTCSRCTLC
jgi:hypothetical protein